MNTLSRHDPDADGDEDVLVRHYDAMEDKRRASGHSPELLSIADARIAGMKAGQQGTAAALNPYDHDTPEHKEWERARKAALAVQLAGSFC